MEIRAFRTEDESAVVALWERCGLIRPWNDPRKDIARKLAVQPELFLVGLADHTIVTTLCPGGKERMRRLMNVVRGKAYPFRSLVTHGFRLDEIEAAYDLFANQRDGVLKVGVGSGPPLRAPNRPRRNRRRLAGVSVS